MSKETLLYNAILKDVLNLDLGSDLTPDDLKVEVLTEKAIAKVANLTWVGAENLPWDFAEDKSDAKTSNVAERVSVTYQGTITGTETKEGALRCVVTNEFSPNKVDYFYIPAHRVDKLSSAVGGTKNSGKKSIKYSYSKAKDEYGKIDEFRCNSFEEMCQKS